MIADSHYRTQQEAEQEARRRRADPDLAEAITKMFPSSYGGYVVRSMPADWLVDGLIDGPPGGTWPHDPKRYTMRNELAHAAGGSKPTRVTVTGQ